MNINIFYVISPAPASANSPMETEKITFEGKVAQKLECRPTGMKWKKYF